MNKTIIDPKINLNTSLLNNLNNQDKDLPISVLIESIITKIRLDYQNITKKDINEELFTNKCDLFQAITYYTFQDYGFSLLAVQTQKVISNDVEGHSLVIVSRENQYYLIDLTYKQFFIKNKCQKENYIIDYKNQIILLSPYPGYYYLNNPDNFWLAKQLIEKGYVLATLENLKIYFDSFYLTKRGRYINEIPTISNISGNTYLNSILKNEDTIHYTREQLEQLGFINNINRYQKYR